VTYDYIADQGFDTIENAELKCKKCLEDNKVIKSATSGVCTDITTICSTNEAFIRNAGGLSDESNHLGICITSTICSIFDYSLYRGFESLEFG